MELSKRYVMADPQTSAKNDSIELEIITKT
jgi:hypothetical protein